MQAFLPMTFATDGLILPNEIENMSLWPQLKVALQPFKFVTCCQIGYSCNTFSSNGVIAHVSYPVGKSRFA